MSFNQILDPLTQLAVAKMSGCEYFITYDKGILKKRTELEKQYKIKIRTPEEFDREG